MIEIIENAGPNTLSDALGALLRSSSAADFHVAFVSNAGVDAVLSGLHRVATRGTVRLVTGLYQGVTEPSALRNLLRASQSTNGKIEARLSTNPKLHTKFYILSSPNRRTCIVGSSNLTADGLRSSGELSLLFRASAGTGAVSRLVDVFEDSWTRHSVPLTKQLIDKYEARRSSQPRPALSVVDIRSILGEFKGKPGAVAFSEDTPRRSAVLWRDCLTGFFGPATDAVLERETDWDRRGWDCYSYPSPALRVDDAVVVFDFSQRNQTVSLARVRAKTRTSVPTPDGRRFVAYSRFPRTRVRRLTNALWAELIEVGVVSSRKRARQCVRLAPDKIDSIRRLLR